MKIDKQTIKLKTFQHYKQLDAMDCGATCLRMIVKYYGKSYTSHTLKNKTYLTREGVTLLGISDAAESLGMRTIGVKSTLEALEKENVTPFIAHWEQNHFVVVYKISKDKVYVADPATSKISYSKQEFISHWASTQENGESLGVALLLEPTPNFYEQTDEQSDKTKFSFLFKYLRPHKKLIWQFKNHKYNDYYFKFNRLCVSIAFDGADFFNNIKYKIMFMAISLKYTIVLKKI